MNNTLDTIAIADLADVEGGWAGGGGGGDPRPQALDCSFAQTAWEMAKQNQGNGKTPEEQQKNLDWYNRTALVLNQCEAKQK
jgi:hypothetical protein